VPRIIHNTAIIDPEAHLEDNVEIGPYCIVGPGVHVGEGCRLQSHCVLEGPTQLGPGNIFHPFVVVGGPAQDISFRGEHTSLVIGAGNTFREHVTVHRGTAKGQGLTRIGDHGLFMAGSHIAHDCEVGDSVILANQTLLGGHVKLASYVVTGGHVALAPFVQIGSTVFLAGGAKVERSIPPYVIAAGDRAHVRALNRVGLKRRGIPLESYQQLKKVFSLIFLSKLPRKQALERIPNELKQDPWVKNFLVFFERSDS
jgi:UDP-N-acetylglucosamine acyltransferase